MLPDSVLFGLIFVNFLPLNILPQNNPPMSEEIHTKIQKKINNLNSIIWLSRQNNET